jgi:hypothetical protein
MWTLWNHSIGPIPFDMQSISYLMTEVQLSTVLLKEHFTPPPNAISMQKDQQL